MVEGKEGIERVVALELEAYTQAPGLGYVNNVNVSSSYSIFF